MLKFPDARKILLINLGGLGDCLLSMPSLRLLKLSYSQARISLLTVGRSTGLFEDFKFIDEIIIFKPGLAAKVALFYKLRKSGFDMVINMRPLTSIFSSIKMAILFFVINARYKIGRDTENRGFFLNVKIPEGDYAKMHDLDYYFYMLEALGLNSQERGIDLILGEEESNYIDKFLAQQGVGRNDILIGINPGASTMSRRWPLENFAKLINLLKARSNCKIIITASREEGRIISRLMSLINLSAIDASDRTNPKQLLALIKRCRLFISNDAGPMHLAAALHVPLIALFGPGDITRYDPRRLWDKAVVFDKRIDCAPCFKARCRSMECFKCITAEEVADAAIKLL